MTHVHEDLGAYVLGSLDEGDASRVRAHIDECPHCAEAYAELSGLPGLLDLAVVASTAEEEPLPPALEERLLDRFARERPRPEPRRRWRPRLFLGIGGALAGAAAAAATLLVVLGFQQPRTFPASQYPALPPPPTPARRCGRSRAAPSYACGSTTCRPRPATSTR
jgi:anti-sigma factor RsiW